MRAVGRDGPKLVLVAPGRRAVAPGVNSARRVGVETWPAFAKTIGAAVWACEGCAPPATKTAATSAEIISVRAPTSRVSLAPAIFTPVQDFGRVGPVSGRSSDGGMDHTQRRSAYGKIGCVDFHQSNRADGHGYRGPANFGAGALKSCEFCTGNAPPCPFPHKPFSLTATANTQPGFGERWPSGLRHRS